MKKLLCILLTLLLGFSGLTLSAQQTVEIGTGTSTTYITPFNSLWGYSFVEQIYTSEEIDMAGSITSIKFNNSSTGQTNNITVYMKLVSRTSFTSATDYETVTAADIVYTGSHNFAQGWSEITLDTPFDYDGASNLLIAVHEYTSGYSTQYFYYTSATNTVITFHSDSADPDPYNLGSYSGNSYTSSNRANIQLEIMPSSSNCYAPLSPAISNITPNGATLSWTPRDGQTAWEVCCESGPIDFDQVSWTPVYDSTYTFSGLTSATNYTAYVRTVCGTEVSNPRQVNFATIATCPTPTNFTASIVSTTEVALSWTGTDYASSYNIEYGPTGFTPGIGDGTTENEFGTTHNVTNIIEGTTYDYYLQADCGTTDGTSYWVGPITLNASQYIMTSTGSDTATTCGLLIYDDGGPNGNYGANCNSTLVLYPANDGEMMMLSGTASMESGWDYLYIYDGVGTDNLIAQISGENQTVSVLSTTGPLTLKYTSDGSVFKTGFELLAQCVSCFPPSNLSVSDQSLDGATVSWSGNADEYAIYLTGAMTGYFTTYDTSYTFTGLNGSSNYAVQIRSLCSGDSSILSSPISFSTTCEAITVTDSDPWTEDFESYTGDGATPFVCWATPVTYNASNGVAPFVYCNYGDACHSGLNSAEMKGTLNMLVLPEFTNDIHDLRLSFWATYYGSGTDVVVGVISDISDTATFEPVGNAGIPGPRGGSNAGNGNYMGPFDFNGVQATSGRIALRFTGNSSSGWNVDDFTVEIAPNCPSPVKTSVQVANIGGHTATVSFVDNDQTHNSWTVFYREADATESDPWMSVTTSTNTADLSNLDPETEYDVYVITNCSTPSANPDATLTVSFTTSIACPAPTAMTLSAVSADEATVTWTCAGSSYNVEYGPVGFTPGAGTTSVASTESFTMSNLTPNTTYTIIVANDCSADNDGVSTTTSFTFTTSQIPVDLPYAADFSDPTDDWVLNNGSCSNFWMMGSVNNVNALFVTNDSVNPGYNTSDYTVVTAEKLITVGDNASFNITFDANVGGESSYDYLKVFFAPATSSYPASTSSTYFSGYEYSTYAVDFSDYIAQTGYNYYPYKLNLTEGNTFHIEVEMANPNTTPDATSTAKLVFMWKDDTSSGTQPGAVISNVTVSVNSCPAPTALADSNITTTSADIYWTPGDQESEWEVEYGVPGFAHGAGTIESVYGDPAVTLDNLSVATHYDVYVRARCSATDTSLWVGPLTFVTNCEMITTLPYTENFDSYSASSSSRPDCWSFPVTYSSAPYITSSYNASAPNCLYFNSQTATPTTAVTPQFDADINTLRVKFMLKAESLSYSGTFEVGVMSDPNNVSTFESVQIIQPTTTAWTQYTVYFDSTTMTGSGKYIAFRQHSNSSSWYYWLDDVTVMLIPTCEEPSDIVSTGSTSTSVTLGWTSHGEESSWNIEYGPAGFTPGNGDLVSAGTNPFEIDNLTSGTTYDFYVQADCGGGDESIWIGPYSATPGSYNMPTSGTNTITGCNLVIYDDGGINGDYSSSCQSYLTIYPETTGFAIAIQGTLSTESCCDYLRIYDGPDATGTLLGEFKGSNVTIPEQLSTTGPLTLYFYSDGSVVYPGFELNVSCVSNTCPKPTNVHATGDATTSSVTLDWTPSGSETSWEIAYGEGTFDPEDVSATVVTANAHPFEVQNLTSSTAYTFYVRAICSADDQSTWTLPIIANTACDIITTFPYTEGFENGGYMPACWSQEYVTGTTDWTFQAGAYSSSNINAAHSGSYNAYMFSSSDNETKLVSPVFDLTGVTNPMLSFWHAQPAWSTDQDQLTVYYRTSNTSEWTQLQQFTTSITDWTLDSIALPSASGTYQIAFDGFTTYGYGIVLDDITICESGSGPVITNPTVATNAASAIAQTTATLNATITNPDNVTITAKGFEWKATTGGTYTQVAGTGTGNSFTANLSNLNPSTNYTFKAFITYNGTTVYGSEMTFTTLPQGVDPCAVPTGLHTTNIENHAITIAWDANASVESWNIQYRVGTGTWSSATSTTNSYTITNLQGNTDYEIQVQANCGNGNLSDWSSSVTAHTTNVGIENFTENNVTLFPNPAKEYVDIRIDGDVNVTNMEVFDVYGKLINTVNVIDNPTRINVNGLANGMYFVRVTTDKGAVTKTFVKK